MTAELAARILAAARARGWRVTAAESCTGGLVSAALTDLAGASDIFDYGFVTYSNAAKTAVLGVRPQTLDAFGAVSEAVAAEMAAGALDRAGADVAVAVTGIAGPGGSAHKPEGRVCFGLALRDAAPVTGTREFDAQGRGAVRSLARDHALALIAQALE